MTPVRWLATVAGVTLPLLVVSSTVAFAGASTPTTVSPGTTPFSGSTTTVTPTTSRPGPTTTTTLPTFSGFVAQSASFVTADNGYVLGAVSCGGRICLALRHTTDRGAKWTSLPTPPVGTTASGVTGVTELHFADARNGWAYGNTMWVTHDGARHWRQVNVGGTVDAMVSGAGEAFVLVDPCGFTSCPSRGELLRSPVGRDDWKVVPGVTGRFDQSSPADLVAAGRAVYVLSTDPTPEIFGALDGVHFFPLPVPCQAVPGQGPSSSVPAGLAARTPSDMAVVCLGGPASGQVPKQAYVSVDSGHTYIRVSDPPVAGDGAALVYPSPGTLLLETSSAASGVDRLGIPHGRWSSPLGFSDEGIGSTDLAFVDAGHGVVVHAPFDSALFFLGQPGAPRHLGELYLTNDGGASWHPQPISH
jgi:hypothetical protein